MAFRSQNEHDELGRYLQQIENLPQKIVLPEEKLSCMGCKKLFPAVGVRQNWIVQGRHLTYVDVVCDSCRPSLKDKSVIVCAGCKEAVLRVDPHKDKDGFAFEKGKTYHLDKCPVCEKRRKGLAAPVNVVSLIIEKHLWLKRIKK